jgi:Fe-S-cluster containining protein
MEPFYERQPLRFDCTCCGRCCVTGGGYYVFLDGKEAESIRAYLKLSRGWFRRRYLQRLPDGDLVVASKSDGRCVFLEVSGRCGVYPVRPTMQHVSVLAEIVSGQTDWKRESRRCEGIDRGEVVSLPAWEACQRLSCTTNLNHSLRGSNTENHWLAPAGAYPSR